MVYHIGSVLFDATCMVIDLLGIYPELPGEIRRDYIFIEKYLLFHVWDLDDKMRILVQLKHQVHMFDQIPCPTS